MPVLREYDFVAWVGIPSTIYLDGLERAVRTILPGLVSLPNPDSDEADMWRYQGDGVTVEVQRPVASDATGPLDADLGFICMFASHGQKRLANPSILLAQLLTDGAGVQCRPLGGD